MTTIAIRLREEAGPPALELLDGDGRWVPFEGTAGDPMAELTRRVTAAVPADAKAVAVVGIGLGHVIEAIARRAPEAHVIAVEPNRDLVTAASKQPRVKDRIAQGRLTLSWGPDYESLGTVRTLLGQVESLPIVINPVLARVCAGHVADARARLRQRVFEARANEDARRANAGRYLLNTLRNLHAIATEGDVTALDGLFDKLPAVVVAAGPSLDRTIADLRAVSERALVIAVDTAVKPLLAAGITPRMVVAMDPTEENARHLRDVPNLPATWLVAEASVNPHLMQPFTGRTFLLSLGFDPWPWISSVGVGRGKLRAWGSVATTAYDLALVLGCAPIGLAGFDFAFTDGRPYCRNTEFEHDWADAAAWGEALESIWGAWTGRWRALGERDAEGRELLTAPHLVAFRDWVLKDIQRQPRDRNIFTASRGILVHPSIPRRLLTDGIGPGFDARAVATDRLTRAHRVPAAATLERAVDEIRSSTATSGEPFDAWMRFAAAVSIGDIRAAFAAASEPKTETQLPAGPHVRPEETARLRDMLTGSAAPSCVSLADTDSIIGQCADIVSATEACASRFSARLRERADDGRRVPASAFIEWTGSAYATVRRLEAALAARASEQPAPDFMRGSIEPVQPAADGGRLEPAAAARVAVVRETALSLVGGPADHATIAAAILRAADPACGSGALRCDIHMTGRHFGSAWLDSCEIGRVITGCVAEEDAAPHVDVEAGPIRVRLTSAESVPSPVLRFLGPSARRVAPRLLSDGIGRSLFGQTLDDRRALLNPILGDASVAIDESGFVETQPAWPHPILGEILTSRGGRVGWNNAAGASFLMHRTADGAADVVEPTAFRPNRVIEWEDERFLCVGFEGGLWLWTPGAPPDYVGAAPPALSLIKTADGVRLDPIERTAEGYTARAPLDYAWNWRPDAPLERLPLGPEGPCWSVASRGNWSAAAYPHADFVRLTHQSGRTIDLGCYYPVTLAWAGASLIVLSSTGGTVLMFERLAERL